MKNSILIVGAAILVIIIALLFAFGRGSPAVSPTGGTNLLAVQLTDPPQVPNGTQSLVIAYSSVEAHVEGGAGAGWIQSNGSGSINLLSLVNLRQTIGTVNIPNNTQVNILRFNITSAKITINGTTYNVTVPGSQISANIEGSNVTNRSTGLLLSLSPTVVTILTANSTVFVMVPSVRAVILPNGTNQTSVQVGYKANLGVEAQDKLESVRPNLTINSGSLSVSGNTITFSVIVNNNGNRNATIKHISLYGDVYTLPNFTTIDNNTLRLETELRDQLRNNSVCVNVSSNTIQNLTIQDRPLVGVSTNLDVNASGNVNPVVVTQNNSQDQGSKGDNSNKNQSQGGGSEANASEKGQGQDFGNVGDKLESQFGLKLNTSVCTVSGLQEFQNELRSRLTNISSTISNQQMHLKMVSLLVAANGTIIIPAQVEDAGENGYLIPPGQSHTFTFTGSVSGNDNVITSLLVGKVYKVVVSGEEGAEASLNLTAQAS